MASASSFQLSSLQIQTPPLKKSNFLGQSVNLNLNSSVHTKTTMKSSSNSVTPIAKFNLYEILGGRGLCNGEEGIEKELQKSISEEQKAAGSAAAASDDDNQENKETGEIPEDGFEKEMMGFTGGFPGGEKGLKKFIEKNPPPPKKTESSMVSGFNQSLVKKPKPPELPLLLPGMIAIVKNSNNPYYMYCGIVQRITDGKAAVLFEGGNWDRLISFRLEELERREKGPPMVNLKSVILEKMVENSSEA